MTIFQGYASPRYQQHDVLIKKLVGEFNTNKQLFIGASPSQASGIPDLTEDIVKSWIIQESGGNDPQSLAAWLVDPAQVNVPGDWSSFKQSAGLNPPVKRNEGTVDQNLRAAIIWLARKGFGKAGQPPQNRSGASFDGWHTALQRYNGRSVITANGKSYSENYAQRILDRANNPAKHIPIRLPKP